MPHFYSSDLMGVAAAALLGVPLIVLPGYGLGWWFNLFDFRTLSAATRWSLSAGFGLTIEPILLYLSFRLLSVYLAWLVVAVLSGSGLIACYRRGAFPKLEMIPKSAKIIGTVWTVLCIGLMLDVHIGSALFPSSVIVDTSFRSQVISALANSYKLPAISYFYHPGHPVTLRYHYAYFLIPALTVQIGHGLVSSAMALVALSLWTGLAFLGVVSAFSRFFWKTDRPERLRNLAWVLLAVGGLDLLFSGSQAIQRWHSHQFVFTGPDIGLWNGWGSGFSWLSTAVFSPHHLGGLMAGSLCCVLLWHSRLATGWKRWSSALISGLMLATLGGTSLYVGAMFAIFLCLVFIELLLNAPFYARPLALTGITAVALIALFFFDVRPPSSQNAPAFFEFQIRGFLPITLLFPALGISSKIAWNLGYFLSLPLSYLCVFGVYFIGGVWWIWNSRTDTTDGRFRNHLILGLIAVSIIIPSIAWSGMEISNDLGFRGILPAQFLLLFCTAELLSRNRIDESRATKRLTLAAIVFLVIGIGSTLLEMATLRLAIGTTAEKTIQVGEMFRLDTSAERLGELRNVYSWIRHNTSRDAVVEENPTTWQMVSFGQYAERPTVVYGSNPNYMVGENHAEYLDTVAKVQALYAAGTTWRGVVAGCSEFGLSYIVVQNGDGAWNDATSYVWTEPPVFVTPMVRVFRCH